MQGRYHNESRIEPKQYNKIISLISQQLIDISLVISQNSNMIQNIMQKEWQDKINDRLKKYPHRFGQILFKKTSSQCWNTIYSRMQQNRSYYNHRNIDPTKIQQQINNINIQINQQQIQRGINYSI